MRFKALITDLDGTLVDLRINWDYLRVKVRELLKIKHPLKPLGPSLLQVKAPEHLLKRAFEIIENEEIKASYRASKDERLILFFKELKSLNVKIGLVTLQGIYSTFNTLVRLGILDFLDVIVTREFSLLRYEQLSEAIRMLHVTFKDVVFIGDTIMDKEVGSKIGCHTIIVRGVGEIFKVLKLFR